MDPIGRVKWNTNQRIDSARLTAVGTAAWQSLTSVLARLLTDHATGEPISGFFGDDCVVSVDSGLDLEVAPGLGFYYDDAESDPFTPRYKPVVVDAVVPVTLDAHDGEPRIDVISVAPATVDDTSASVSVWSDGQFDPEALDTRTLASVTVTVTKGTPASSPVAPATPTGHVTLAEVLVPATSGAVEIADHRAMLPELTPPRQRMSLDPIFGSWSSIGGSGTPVFRVIGSWGVLGVSAVETTEIRCEIRLPLPLRSTRRPLKVWLYFRAYVADATSGTVELSVWRRPLDAPTTAAAGTLVEIGDYDLDQQGDGGQGWDFGPPRSGWFLLDADYVYTILARLIPDESVNDVGLGTVWIEWEEQPSEPEPPS